MKKLLFTALVLVLTACSGTITGQVGAEQTIYMIGAVAPLSGQGTNLGEPWVRGARHAVDEINAQGGINGRNISLVVKDGEFNGKKSITAARSVLSTNDPDIITTLFYLPANAINSLMQDSEVPFHYSAYTKDLLESNPRAFKAHFNGKEGCRQLARYAKEEGVYEKLGLLMSNTKYGKRCAEGVREVAPNASLYWYEVGTKDFRTLLTKAHNDGVDTLMGIYVDPEAVNVYSQLTELGYNMNMLCVTASECVYPSVEERVPQSVLNGTVSIEFLPLNVTEDPVVQEILSSQNASFTEASWAALGYDEIKYMAAAMEECEPGQHDCIFRSMQQLDEYESIVGTEGFENRSLQADYDIYRYSDGWNVVQQ